MKASKRSLCFQFISLLEQFSIKFGKGKSEMKNSINLGLSHMFSRASRSLPDSTLSSHWLLLMLTFVLIDGCEYVGFSLSRVRVCYIFYNQFKTSPSKINCISNIFSFQVKKMKEPSKA